MTYSSARFGMGTGLIYFNNLACTGTETSIFDCMSDGVGVFGTCTHANDAAIMCHERKLFMLVCLVQLGTGLLGL